MFKILFSIFLICWFAKPSFSQGLDVVTIKTLGQGKTIQDATTQALREAISQAFGVFISANTTIVNDSLLKDEIVSLTTGNIQKYSILSQTEVPGIGYSIFVNADVSLNRLSSFAQSKGSEATFDGGGFAMNIKLQKLNEQAELVSMNNLLYQAWEYINSTLQFNLELGQPNLVANDSTELYNVKANVIALIADSTRQQIETFILGGLQQISMSQQEGEDYSNLSKPIYHINKLNFRNKASLHSFFVFSYKLNQLICGFRLSNNLNENINQSVLADADRDIIEYIPEFYSMRGFDFFIDSKPILNDPLVIYLLKIQNGNQFIDSLSNFKNDITPFSNTDIVEFDRYYGKLMQLNYPADYEYNELKRKSSEIPPYVIDNHLYEGLIHDELGPVDRENQFFFEGIETVTFDFMLYYSLSELEQLKDFKVIKITN